MIRLSLLIIGALMVCSGCVTNHKDQLKEQPVSLSSTNNQDLTKRLSDISTLGQLIDTVCREDKLSHIVLMDHTSAISEKGWLQIQEEIITHSKIVEHETLLSFKNANKKSISLKNIGKLTTNYQLISARKKEFIFDKGGWGNFYKVYPERPVIAHFSNFGINKTGTQALIQVFIIYSLRRAGRSIYLLEYKDQKWVASTIFFDSIL